MIAEIKSNINTYWNDGGGGYYLAEDAIEYSIKTAPTADVVPKSEVESMSHKCEDCAGCTQWVCECSLIEEYAKTEVAREIFEEIEKIAMHGVTPFGLCLMSMGESSFAELKKKYTEI